MDICELGKIEVILGMPWLAAHNPEINWETGEVKMTRCLPLCGQTPERKMGNRGRQERSKMDYGRERKEGENRRGPQKGGRAGAQTLLQVEKGV